VRSKTGDLACAIGEQAVWIDGHENEQVANETPIMHDPKAVTYRTGAKPDSPRESFSAVALSFGFGRKHGA